MATEVMMPQMGESIAEGTIVRGIKQVGDRVDRDEPLFEISTDKVDTEVQAPTSGVLLEIRAKQGDTVEVNTVVALIGGEGEQVAGQAPTGTQAPAARPAEAASSMGHAADAAAKTGSAPAGQGSGAGPATDRRREHSSPLDRRIAKQHGVNVGDIAGTGIGG